MAINIFDTDFIFNLEGLIPLLPNRSICCLFLTNKHIKQYIESDEGCLRLIDERVEELVEDNPDRVSNMPMTTLMKRLSLYTFKGCMMCGAKRIRKVYEAFQMRLCRKCLYDNTIEEYYLKRFYGMQEDSFRHLPHTISEIYIRNRRVGLCTLTHYWKETIEQILGRRLRDMDEERHKELEERVREEKARESAAQDRRNERQRKRDAYFAEWHRIFCEHIENPMPLNQLMKNEYFCGLYGRRIKHTEDTKKVHKLYENIMNS